MRIDVVSIFPDYLAPLGLSLAGKAQASGLLDVHVHDLRRWTHDRHRTVDDTPYGGGAGMVMKPEPWGEALDELTSEGPGDPLLVVPTPSGEPFAQPMAEELSREQWLVFACGRYEGIDQRVIDHARTRMRVREVSIGDYVLNGGEVAALVVVEAVVRLLPGFMGNPESLAEESHGGEGLLEYPVYTKPPTWRGLDVPEVLFSGHHAQIARWRRDQALRRTAERRPDLVARLPEEALGQRDREVLADFAPD
ncbi:MAG TPA: tRNA (guanosine(37)-N1)-methyltransferase TrmD [Nocardioidaceae bacterium]|nr:tRNA (guanosine(37)-N1)-methyltransferase TrmD [Nocardioidaceae bacterium]